MNESSSQTGPVLPPDIARRMQAIIDRHSQEYRQDLPHLLEAMQAHAARIRKPATAEEALPLLKREAHDMKGQAATFGLPSLSVVAQSLCRLLDHGNRDHADFADVAELHVAALSSLVGKDDPAVIDRVKSEAARMGVVTK